MNLKQLSGNKSRRVSDGENDYEDYKQKLAAFLPTINAKDVDSYYDDLYLRVTPESTAFIKSLPQPTYKVGGWRVSIFVDNIEKDRWYEIKIGNPYGDLRGRDSRTDFSQICKGGSISDSRRVSDNWWNDKNDRFWWGIHIEYKNGVMSDGGDKDLNSDEEAIERASKLAAQGNNNIAVVEAYRVDLPENETLGTITVLKHIDVMDI